MPSVRSPCLVLFVFHHPSWIQDIHTCDVLFNYRYRYRYEVIDRLRTLVPADTYLVPGYRYHEVRRVIKPYLSVNKNVPVYIFIRGNAYIYELINITEYNMETGPPPEYFHPEVRLIRFLINPEVYSMPSIHSSLPLTDESALCLSSNVGIM